MLETATASSGWGISSFRTCNRYKFIGIMVFFDPELGTATASSE
jgi:hypothetical protein